MDRFILCKYGGLLRTFYWQFLRHSVIKQCCYFTEPRTPHLSFFPLPPLSLSLCVCVCSRACVRAPCKVSGQSVHLVINFSHNDDVACNGGELWPVTKRAFPATSCARETSTQRPEMYPFRELSSYHGPLMRFRRHYAIFHAGQFGRIIIIGLSPPPPHL